MENENIRIKLLLALSVFLLLFANLSYWISSNFYNAERFQSLATETFSKQSVRDAIADGIIEKYIAEDSRLGQIVSSPAKSAISGLLGSPQLTPVIERAALGFQKYITGGQKEVSINLAPINNILTAIARVSSGRVETPELKNTEIVLLPENAFPRLENWLKFMSNFGPLFFIVGIALVGFSYLKVEDRIVLTGKFGQYLGIGTLLNLFLLPYASMLIMQNSQGPNAATVFNETFKTFSASYKSQLATILTISFFLFITPYLFKLARKSIDQKRTSNQVPK